MSSRNFRAMLEAKWSDGKFVCVGLDPDVEKMPVHLRRQSYNLRGIIVAVSNFLARIVDETKDIVCAYKPNSAFFEGIMFGREILVDTINHIHRIAPDVPIILDAKRGDIGNTNGGYVRDTFDHLNVDAITVHPYLGQEAMQPFLDKKDKGILVLCRTSNKGADEFQNHGEGSLAGMLYEKVAARVASYWNTNGNCGLVVGAT
ncbi:MAG: orotidine-5'-phosphate decarboxylase, partial [Candidatus Taylorbacteria bacterium]|nr:orotidine-5'-phosphate decarboxylase [Candidatus Taylorbacteria bacterium]